VLAARKWCLSFRKHDWNLNDYPIGITEQDYESVLSAPRFINHRYRAYIINWNVMGLGETPEQARTKLEENFEKRRQDWLREGGKLVRPGKNSPPEFASQEKVAAYEAISEDFIQRILCLEWAWISDESSLWDFHAEPTNELLWAKIKEIYGVDVADLESAKLWTIFERIERNSKTFGPGMRGSPEESDFE
jgi:hypothetical protein